LVLHENILYINELKDGMSLDTKKSDAEITEIKMVKQLFENKTNLKCKASIVLWVCKNLIDSSIKSDEARDHIIRGLDLCEILNIDLESVEKNRFVFNESNREYLIHSINKIVQIKNNIEYKK
jgi:hypothetical protein